MADLKLHPEPERLESYLEGTLEEAGRSAIESHVAECSRCQGEVEEWQALFAVLESLPEVEPSPDFADRVMAGVTVAPSPARGAVAARWLPRGARGWSLVAAFLALPLTGLSALVAWVLTQPWATALSAEAILAFGWSQAAAAVSGLWSRLATMVLESGAVHLAAAALQQFLAVAGTRGLGAVVAIFSVAALGSAWVLYHNLVRNSSRDGQYAPYTI